jgi:hypothetical protein
MHKSRRSRMTNVQSAKVHLLILYLGMHQSAHEQCNGISKP